MLSHATADPLGPGNSTDHRLTSVTPPHRSSEVVPVGAVDYVVAVAQERDGGGKLSTGANPIIGVATDKAIGLGDDAADPRAAAAPSHCPASTIPRVACHHIVAVAQRGDSH